MSSVIMNLTANTPSAALVDAPPEAQQHAHSLSDYISIGLLSSLWLAGTAINATVLHHLMRLYTKKAHLHRQNDLKMAFLLLKINITIANLIVCALSVPIYLSWVITYGWVTGDALCKAANFVFMFAINFAANSIVCIAVDRARIVHSMISAVGRGNIASVTENCMLYAKMFVGLAFVTAFITSLPQLYLWLTIQPQPQRQWYQCVTVWTADAYSLVSKSRVPVSSEAYSVFHLLTAFWIPFFIIVVCYGYILLSLLCPGLSSKLSLGQPTTGANSKSTAEPSCTAQQPKQPADSTKQQSVVYVNDTQPASTRITALVKKSDKRGSGRAVSMTTSSMNSAVTLSSCHWRRQVRSKTSLTAGLVVGCYLACFLPYNVLGLLGVFEPKIAEIADQWLDFLKQLIYLNSVINPFLYGFSAD